MFRFEHIYFLPALGLVAILAGLFIYLNSWKKKTAARIGEPELVKAITANFSPAKFRLKVILALVALAMMVIAIANPQTRGKQENIRKQGLDVMILMDVSKSMLAQDVKPNRLEKSRQLVSKLIDELKDNRVGLIWFAGRSYMQMPLTADLAAAHMYLQNAGPDAVPTQGTVIAEALKMAGTAFNAKEKKYKAIVLISDGEDHDPEAQKVARSLVEAGVMINTVGVGSPEGSTIFDPETNDTKKDAQGRTVVSKLNEQELRNLASTGNGVYVFLQDPAAAANTIRKQLGTVEQKTLEDSSFIQYETYFYIFLALALLALLAEPFIADRKTPAL
ncbi:VWA domain-containing protein [Flavihumibacter rivuli]|uniref:VWA domain-containing protein n=1 Tax=Flavihumibacter rivuli TaxID=2838156 RepID=UPI001BDF03FD|nr:VWA domain-containing protein [Flavihumibacter rivuli]ULQ56194.1 VWA domain-containing protein [Flavihumibacter rivuli]